MPRSDAYLKIQPEPRTPFYKTEFFNKFILYVVFIILTVAMLGGAVYGFIYASQRQPFTTIGELKNSGTVKDMLNTELYKNNFTTREGERIEPVPKNYITCEGSIEQYKCVFDNFEKAANMCLKTPNCRAIFVNHNYDAQMRWSLSTSPDTQNTVWKNVPLLTLVRK